MFFRAGNSIPALFHSYSEKGGFRYFLIKMGTPVHQK
jgi:hypothetical protein